MKNKFIKIDKSMIDSTLDVVVKPGNSELSCTVCLPSAPMEGHPELNGVLFHSRIDCPEDTVYMLNSEIKFDEEKY